jgi:AcrR family transcriptional regulator
MLGGMRAVAPPQVRGERLVEKVIEAALEELAAKGFAAMSIEEVADRAGVAKTTIYRRWPTKADLVLAAMHSVADDFIMFGDTGSVRGDLIAMLGGFRDFAKSVRGASLIRMMQIEDLCSEVSKLATQIRKEKETEPHAVIARAVRRGELPRGTDPALVIDTLFAAVQNLIVFQHAKCDDRKVAQLVDLVLDGAANGGARQLRRAK